MRAAPACKLHRLLTEASIPLTPDRLQLGWGHQLTCLTCPVRRLLRVRASSRQSQGCCQESCSTLLCGCHQRRSRQKAVSWQSAYTGCSISSLQAGRGISVQVLRQISVAAVSHRRRRLRAACCMAPRCRQLHTELAIDMASAQQSLHQYRLAAMAPAPSSHDPGTLASTNQTSTPPAPRGCLWSASPAPRPRLTACPPLQQAAASLHQTRDQILQHLHVAELA